MAIQSETAISALRAFASYESSQEGIMPGLLRSMLKEKDIPFDVIRLAHSLKFDMGEFFLSYFMRETGKITSTEWSFLFRQALSQDLSYDYETGRYEGYPDENVAIDTAHTLNNNRERFIGLGAMAAFRQDTAFVGRMPDELRRTKIAIIGVGAAGTMTYAALRFLGFINIHIFDKKDEVGGIWLQPNVSKGTKNNPRPLSFRERTLEVANGNGAKDGASVLNFIQSVGRLADTYTNGKKIVRRVQSAPLSHTIYFEGENRQEEFEEFPIVINCMGTGKPRDLSDKRRMTLIANSERPVAIRWQNGELKRENVEGKSFALFGLGNSTAEMMSSLNQFRRAGVDCDYRVFTHFSEDAIQNPDEYVPTKRHGVTRVFRDLSRPNLTGFQGDLPRSRQDYFQALREDKIIGDVDQWGVNRKIVTAKRRNFPFDRSEYSYNKLYALIGYQQEKETLERFSISFSTEGATIFPKADFDGEFRNDYEILTGYFGLGSLMDAPHDQNAVVIPGMMYRMNDMLFTIVMRAFEVYGNSKKLVSKKDSLIEDEADEIA